MDQKVWSKAIDDTSGLLDYYNLTKENYRWDKELLQQFTRQMTKLLLKKKI